MHQYIDLAETEFNIKNILIKIKEFFSDRSNWCQNNDGNFDWENRKPLYGLGRAAIEFAGTYYYDDLLDYLDVISERFFPEIQPSSSIRHTALINEKLGYYAVMQLLNAGIQQATEDSQDNSKDVEIKFSASPAYVQVIKSLRLKNNAKDNDELIRNALRLLSWYHDQRRHGRHIQVKYPDRTVIEVEFVF